MVSLITIAFAALCFRILAPWQLGKNSRTQQKNHQLTIAGQLAPVPLEQIYEQLSSPQNEYRSITVSGHFLPTPTTIVRLRLIHEQPAVKVLAPFIDTAGHIFLIYRGYILGENPSVAAPSSEKITITARIRHDEAITADKNHPFFNSDSIHIYSLTSSLASAAWKIPLEPGYLELTTNSPGALTTEPLPKQETGPYLSYGIQWIAFGILAPIGLGYFLYTQIKSHRASYPTQSCTSTGSSATESSSLSKTPNKKIRKRANKAQLLAQLRGDTNDSLPGRESSNSELDHSYNHDLSN